MQTSLVERTDGGTALFEVEDISVSEGALFIRGAGYVTVYAAGAWASQTTVLADTEDAKALRAAYAARPATPLVQQQQQFQNEPLRSVA